MLKDFLLTGFQTLQIPITEKQIELFSLFYSFYKESALKMNLSTLLKEEDFAIKHVLDSSVIFPFLNDNQHLLDIGTGGGFPGIVIAILFPLMPITLVDVVEKKVAYLKNLVKELSLPHCSVYNATTGKVPGIFDIITFRAVANLSKLTQIAKPYCSIGTQIIAYKGKKETVEQELIPLQKKFTIKVHPISIPFLDAERNLVIIK